MMKGVFLMWDSYGNNGIFGFSPTQRFHPGTALVHTPL